MKHKYLHQAIAQLVRGRQPEEGVVVISKEYGESFLGEIEVECQKARMTSYKDHFALKDGDYVLIPLTDHMGLPKWCSHEEMELCLPSQR